MTLTNKQTVYISRNKGNQTMEFGQLIEYNIRNISLEESYLKCVGETSQTLFKNTKIEHIYGLEFYAVCFYGMPSMGTSKCIETKLQTSCFYLM